MYCVYSQLFKSSTQPQKIEYDYNGNKIKPKDEIKQQKKVYVVKFYIL